MEMPVAKKRAGGHINRYTRIDIDVIGRDKRNLHVLRRYHERRSKPMEKWHVYGRRKLRPRLD